MNVSLRRGSEVAILGTLFDSASEGCAGYLISLGAASLRDTSWYSATL